MILKRITVPRFKGAKFNKWGLLCITIFSLMACSSTPSSLTYYLLHSPSSGAMSETYPTTAKLMIIDRITLPEYLKHRGLVYQTSDTNLHISTKHLWAEPVEEGLTKSLKQALASRNVKLLRADHYDGKAAIHVSLHVTDFVSTHKGEVTFTGDYVITSSLDELTHFTFDLRTDLENDGFSASIDAMRHAIDKLAETVATKVGKID